MAPRQWAYGLLNVNNMNGENGYWDFPNLRSVIIPIAVVSGQTDYPLDSKVTNLNEAAAIVGLSHRIPVSGARTYNALNVAADLIDATIFNSATVYLNTNTGANRQQLPLADIGYRESDNFMYRIPPDKTIDLVNGKSMIKLSSTSGNITTAAGDIIELVIWYFGNENC